jgi:cysteine-rich repeat protein
MRACPFRFWVLFLVVLTGCNGLLEDYSGTLCNGDGGCIEGYHCVAETGRCELGTVDTGVCASVDTCVSNDGCCPEGCYANSDNDCAPVCGNLQLEPGEVCDDGNTSNADDCPSTCKPNICGDAFLDRQEPRVEACDDGNTVSEVACAYGARTCTGCASTCTEVLALKGPYCGDGAISDGEHCDTSGESASCNANCTAPACGDGIVNASAGEQCDNVGPSNSASCDRDCSVAFCGDNYTNAARGELCDTGGNSRTCNSNCTPAACGDKYINPEANEQCDTGGESTMCDTDCTRVACGDGRINPTAGEQCDDGNTADDDDCLSTTCRRSVCGDGKVNIHGPSRTEACDDGNTANETVCPYGPGTCTTCNATCSGTLSLTGPHCGDRVVSNDEACDDGSTEACGTCNSTCTGLRLALATGRIRLDGSLTGSDLKEGEYFILNDGLHPAVFFEFDKNGSVSGSRIAVPITSAMSAVQLASVIESTINSAPWVGITAAASSLDVDLTNNAAGSFGNRLISETVATSQFSVTGMSGGAGYDCPAGARCARTEDCDLSLECLPDGTCGTP